MESLGQWACRFKKLIGAARLSSKVVVSIYGPTNKEGEHQSPQTLDIRGSYQCLKFSKSDKRKMAFCCIMILICSYQFIQQAEAICMFLAVVINWG